MKNTGMVRRVDSLGRVVIPKEIRKTLDLKEGEPLEIYVERNELVLKKYSPVNDMSALSATVAESLFNLTGKSVIVAGNNSVIAASGAAKHLLSEDLTQESCRIIKESKSFSIDTTDGVKYVKLTSGNEEKFSSELIVPISDEDGNPLGLIAALSAEDKKTEARDISLLKFAARVIAGYKNV